jgi:dipeptidyl aminopeptidase/acylaminoacyl peptidase
MTGKWVGYGFCLLLLFCFVRADAAELEERFIEALERADFDAAHAMFAPQVARAMTAEQLQVVWSGLERQLGEYAGRGPARPETLAGRPMTVFRLEFGAVALDARVSVDAEGRVDGFRLVPAAAAAATRSGEEPRQVEIEVAGALPGLLALPEGPGPFPAVVLIHGSGPNDRDQTIGPNHSFRDLAHGLAARGIASLRYDKRTRVRPEEFVARAYTVQEEVIDDVLAAVELLRQRAEVDPDRVSLVGHSLGGLLAPRIAALLEPRPASVVLLAAPARRLQEIIVEQVEYIAGLDGDVDEAEAGQLEALRAAAAAADEAVDRDSPQPGLMGLPESYLADLNAYDPVATAGNLNLPLLILQGGRDYQVTVAADFARWQAAFDADPAVELVLYPDLDHLFRAGDGMATPASYLRNSGPFDATVLDRIAVFIAKEP